MFILVVFFKLLKIPETLESLRLRKKIQRQGVQSLRNEAYFYVRRNDEG